MTAFWLWAASAAGVALRASHNDSQGLVSVVETDLHRVLLMDSVVIGAEYLADWARDQAVFSGMALMQTIAFLSPRPARVLCLGLGAGTVPEFLRSRGVAADVVEHSAAVAAMAERYFAIGERSFPGSVAVADAFEHLGSASAEARYDVVLSDLYDGDNPLRSLSREHFEAVKERWLTPHATFALNLVAFRSGPRSRLAAAAVRTLRAVFQQVRVFVDHEPAEEPEGPGNLLFVASDAPLAFAPPPDEDWPPESSFFVHANFERWELFGLGDGGGAGVLSAAEPPPAWLREEQDALRDAMRELQSHVLPPEGWALVARLLEGTAVSAAPDKDET